MDGDASAALELDTEVRHAAQAFAVALAETPAFRAFQQAVVALREDAAAGCAIDAYQQHAKSLRSLVILGTRAHRQQAELDRLRQASQQEPSVVAYTTAQHALMHLAQAAAGQLSARIGLDLPLIDGDAPVAKERPSQHEALPVALSDALAALAAALQASPAFIALAAMRTNGLMAGYPAAQQHALARLSAVYRIIGQQLGVDVAWLSRRVCLETSNG